MPISIAQYGTILTEQTVTIANGAATSNAIVTNGLIIVGVRFPATIPSGSPLVLQEAAIGSSTWTTVRINAGVDLTVTPVASRTIVFDNAIVVAGFDQLRFVASENQAAERTFIVLCRPS